MSGPQGAGTPIGGRNELIAWIAKGEKPASAWAIGTEHEKFGYRTDDLRPPPYDGDAGIRAILSGLTRFGWEPVLEGGNVIALARDGASVSLEPGGQLELSGALCADLNATAAELANHLDEVRQVAEPLGVNFLALGFQPKWPRADIPVMPKGRYGIMRAYMPTRGSRGLDMMFRTCTVQVNLDFSSEADMVRKLRVSLALQPIATALFANSPFVEGGLTGRLSERSATWLDTDGDRTGMLPFAFEDGMGYERYVDWALDVPMYFVYRDGRYVDAHGQSFRDFLAGRLPALPGELPTTGDWADHLTTCFPEVRLKRFLEMRGADAGSPAFLNALPALWVGLLYDAGALDAAWDLVRDWTEAERQALRLGVPDRALATPFRGGTVLDVARQVVAIARAGLAARGLGEERFLEPLETVVDRGTSAADELVVRFSGAWGGDIARVFREQSFW
ncbi:glutamate--cysteine ligase [Zavarzinia sp. CC-PAN008]|uniref:glutamate--cysteine ligase n=1 Tax=Zavarzinia sp. CC-PAN008 TaxID=3243332 RepID=UPI003F746C46